MPELIKAELISLVSLRIARSLSIPQLFLTEVLGLSKLPTSIVMLVGGPSFPITE